MRFTSKDNLYQFVDILRDVGYTGAPSQIEIGQWINKLPMYVSRYIADFEIDNQGLYIKFSRLDDTDIHILRIGKNNG